MSPRGRLASTSLAAPLFALAGCFADGHPLGPSGQVAVRVETGHLFATDGAGGSRQVPSSSRVELVMTEDNEAAHGALVTVHVEPATALGLRADTATSTCGRLDDGSFRCRASETGTASFYLDAGTWSGRARLLVRYAAPAPVEAELDVFQAGLPPRTLPDGETGTVSFELIMSAEGSGAPPDVPPTFQLLECIGDTIPPDLGSQWPAGAIRRLTASVRARVTAAFETSLQHAPVHVESLHNEARLSLHPDCSGPLESRMRLELDAGGRTPDFTWCFSSLGGSDVRVTATSGPVTLESPGGASIHVAAEPRLLRVVPLAASVDVGDDTPDGVPLFEVAAYDTLKRRIALDVHLASSDPSVLKLESAFASIEAGGTAQVRVHPLAEGTAAVTAWPDLYDTKSCTSAPVGVTSGGP